MSARHLGLTPQVRFQDIERQDRLAGRYSGRKGRVIMDP
jgi:hypothetical protein